MEERSRDDLISRTQAFYEYLERLQRDTHHDIQYLINREFDEEVEIMKNMQLQISEIQGIYLDMFEKYLYVE